MRIIAGELRGRTFQAPDIQGVRPTTDRVREMIFNILEHQMDFDGISVVDLFAGSGALGIEAISRGASHVTFVERNPKVARHLRNTLATLGIQERSSVVVADVLKLQDLPPCSLVFADPPYAAGVSTDLVHKLSEIHRPGPDGIVVLEHGRNEQPLFPPSWELTRSRDLGETIVEVFRIPRVS